MFIQKTRKVTKTPKTKKARFLAQTERKLSKLRELLPVTSLQKANSAK